MYALFSSKKESLLIGRVEKAISHERSIASPTFLPAVCAQRLCGSIHLYSEESATIICFAHITNQMARQEGDFEKGAASGSLTALSIIQQTTQALRLAR